MLTGLGNPKACFFSRIKAVFMENRGYNDLRRVAEGGHDAAAYLYAILLYRDNGGVVANTAKRYMRQVAGGDSTMSRWLSNKGCPPLCAKSARAIHSSTWRIWGEPLPPPTQVRGDQPCAGAAAAAWKKDDFKFLCFTTKIVGCVAK
jgi:hypothetical protein